MKSWLQNNDVEMYSTHNKGKSAVPKSFIRTLKDSIYKYMTAISKNVYINKLSDIVNKYNNTCHSIIKMKSTDVESSTYIHFGMENNDKHPKFKLKKRTNQAEFSVEKVIKRKGDKLYVK